MSLNAWSPDIGTLWRRLERWDLNKLTWGLGFCFCLVECILCRTSLLAFRQGECEEEKNVRILKEKRGKEGKVASKECDYVGWAWGERILWLEVTWNHLCIASYFISLQE